MDMQNAAPAGPAVFMFTEAVLRPLRWADDSWARASRLKIHEICLYMDQDGYADVLPDMVSGFVLFPKAFQCIDEVRLALCMSDCLRNPLSQQGHGNDSGPAYLYTLNSQATCKDCCELLCTQQSVDLPAVSLVAWMHDAQTCQWPRI